MKQLLLLTLFIPTLLWAQDDSKYLAGAVPVENGKVVFAKEINAPSFSKDEVYDRMLDWADGFFSEDGNRVVYSDKAKGDIAAVGQTDLVFQSTALSLDKTEMNYRVTMECENGKCILKVAGIRYEYNVSYQREPEKYTAEEWITDKYCLNKDKTKLNRGNGKFRRKTVDFIDEMFASASAALGAQAAANVVPATPVTPARTVTPAQTVKPATPVPVKKGMWLLPPTKFRLPYYRCCRKAICRLHPPANLTQKKLLPNGKARAICSANRSPRSLSAKTVLFIKK